MNQDFSDVHTGFRKGRGPRDQIANIYWIIEKAREFQKKSASLTMLKPLTMWITTNCGKFLKRWEPDHLTYLLRNLYAGQEATEPTMEQRTGSKLGKEYNKAVYCYSAYLTTCRVHHVK